MSIMRGLTGLDLNWFKSYGIKRINIMVKNVYLVCLKMTRNVRKTAIYQPQILGISCYVEYFIDF